MFEYVGTSKKRRKEMTEQEQTEVELADRITNTIKANNFLDCMELITNAPIKWCSTCNSRGLTLLQEAIQGESSEIFDNILQRHDMITLQTTNIWGETALHFAIKHEYEDNACKLIRRGAFIHEVNNKGQTFLHLAVAKLLKKVINLLLEKGIKVDAKDNGDCTALHRALLLKDSQLEMDEFVPTLLYYGADPLSDSRHGSPLEIAFEKNYQEITNILLLYTFDKTVPREVNFKLLVLLIQNDPSTFHQILHYDIECTYPKEIHQEYVIDILMSDANTLSCFLKKFHSIICKFFKETLADSRLKLKVNRFLTWENASKNLNLLMETSESLKRGIVEFINGSGLNIFYNALQNDNQDVATEMVTFLLTFGLKCDRSHVDLVFSKYGYCDLFKLLLHLDIEEEDKWIGDCRENGFVSIICNHNLDLRHFFNTANKDGKGYLNHTRNHILDRFVQSELADFLFSNAQRLQLSQEQANRNGKGDLNHILDRFAHSELSDFLLSNAERWQLSQELQTRINSHPKMPTLVEMARNAARKHIGNRFKVGHTKQFYAIINCLPISPGHKKILTLESKLYY